MSHKILDKVNSVDDLKRLDGADIPSLCSDIRDFLIENSFKSGGHLASNLGVTELTVALHRVFDSPRDHIIFDVGHQSYVHKILTGRKDSFDTLRKTGGLSGFTSMKESCHDAFGAGHSSTSLSAALGYAEADRLEGKDSFSIAVLGDGAYTGGMIHEALNNCDPDLRLIVVLNENGMSISVNKGRFASYLSRARISRGYVRWKKNTKNALERTPLIGKPIYRFMGFCKQKIKNLFMSPNYFEDLGLYYIGPVDGNNYKKLEEALKAAKELGKCVILHIKTTKGKGYEPAEKDPDEFHSVYSSQGENHSFHSEFAKALMEKAEKDKKIVAVTAAMGIGTGLASFGEKFPDRYFDVGIAEEHALTFSAGLAAAGLKPYVDIYSTFLQRGYDNVIHDICLQNLPVKLIVDRAGLALSDGATHHGIFDVAFLSHVPNTRILAPICYRTLRQAIEIADSGEGLVSIRYSNCAESIDVIERFGLSSAAFGVQKDFEDDNLPEYLFITYGRIVEKVIEAEKIMSQRGYKTGIILLEELKPYNPLAEKILPYLQNAKKVLFVEEGIKNGGAGMLLGASLLQINKDISEKYDIAAIDDNFAAPDISCDIFGYLGLSPERLVEKITDN